MCVDLASKETVSEDIAHQQRMEEDFSGGCPGKCTQYLDVLCKKPCGLPALVPPRCPSNHSLTRPSPHCYTKAEAPSYGCIPACFSGCNCICRKTLVL